MGDGKGLILAKGRRIDRYEIRELIGRGSHGAVYRAADTRLGRTVALKIFGGGDGSGLDERLRERFTRAALAISKVDHENVVQVLDFGIADGATPYVVMEHLRGQTLESLLGSRGASLAISQAVDVMLAVCAALRACHQVGITHGGLNPRKIFLTETDTGAQVKVIDFGLSAAGRADNQYALGAMLQVCLARRPAGLEAVVLKATHRVAVQRFESVHALGQALWEFASPLGQDRWKNYYFHPRAHEAKEVADASHASQSLTKVNVPTKELGLTPVLAVPLPTPVAGGTELRSPLPTSAGEPSSASASSASDRVRPAPHRRSWIVTLDRGRCRAPRAGPLRGARRPIGPPAGRQWTRHARHPAARGAHRNDGCTSRCASRAGGASGAPGTDARRQFQAIPDTKAGAELTDAPDGRWARNRNSCRVTKQRSRARSEAKDRPL